MFECRACLSRTLRAIAGDALTTKSLRRTTNPVLTTRRVAPPVRRAASTSAATKNDDSNGDDFGGGDVLDQASSKADKRLVRRAEAALRTELQYLSDPFKLAEHIQYTLRCRKPEKALNLCRLASKQRQVIVSWNHCVDWYMSTGQIDEAMKVYNEMKKRAQFPDSYTYVLLLRGLAKPHHHGTVVKKANVIKALTIYNSMTAPNSRVRPSIYHTNAALKVCSDGLDMDALWTIAAKLPSQGPGAPDYKTYAILLNAIRHGAFGDNPHDVHLEQISARRQEAVNQGRRIWQEIIKKWRAGEVHIDEELVCAMGRLLLMSKRMQDWDDVFSLVQQTMNVARQIAPIGSAERHTEHVPQLGEPEEAAAESAEDAEGYQDAPSQRAFQPVAPLPPDPSNGKRPHTLAYVAPGNPILSLLIGTCTELRTPKTANAYWSLLTAADGPYGLEPDRQNFHTLFKLLGKNRASAKAVEILKTMPDNGVIPQNMTFRIVMSTCVRDKNNHNALQHARTIIDEMEKHCADPDVHTLTQYLHLALNTGDGPKIVSALDRLDPIVHNLRSMISYGRDEPKSHVADMREKRETVIFLQAIVGVIDTLMNRSLVPREDFSHWHGRRGILTQFIGRTKDRLDRQANEFEARHQSEAAWKDHKATRKSNGLQMSKTEFALRQLRWQEKKMRKSEEGRLKAIGLKKWDVGQAQTSNEGFADSPMDLAAR